MNEMEPEKRAVQYLMTAVLWILIAKHLYWGIWSKLFEVILYVNKYIWTIVWTCVTELSTDICATGP